MDCIIVKLLQMETIDVKDVIKQIWKKFGIANNVRTMNAQIVMKQLIFCKQVFI